MFFDEEEITPKIQGTFRFNASNHSVDTFVEAASEVRALVEGQLLAKRVHAEQLGFNLGMQVNIIGKIYTSWHALHETTSPSQHSYYVVLTKIERPR